MTASWWQRRAEESYGVPEAELTQWRPWSLPPLRKAFNAAKHTDPRFAAWWEENSKEAYSTGLANPDRDSQVWTRPVAGTGLSVQVWIGDVETILIHVIRRFHYEIEEIQRVDLVGWRGIGKLRKGIPESNLASGTALQIRPCAGAKDGFFPLQEVVLRDILADCEGVVRWGGGDSKVDESLFYIDAGPDDERVRKVADKLRAWDATPGEGAGTGVDVLAPSRRRRADRLARIQRSA